MYEQAKPSRKFTCMEMVYGEVKSKPVQKKKKCESQSKMSSDHWDEAESMDRIFDFCETTMDFP